MPGMSPTTASKPIPMFVPGMVTRSSMNRASQRLIAMSPWAVLPAG